MKINEWHDEVTEGLPMQFMRRHKMLNEIRSKRTDTPSEIATTAAAAAAADTLAATAAAAAAAAAATTAAAAAAAREIARLEHELDEMAAAAAAGTGAAAATTNAAANAAAWEIARLEQDLAEMTHWLMTASTPKTFYPASRDLWEVNQWVTWCVVLWKHLYRSNIP
jgi:hypothetical protein